MKKNEHYLANNLEGLAELGVNINPIREEKGFAFNYENLARLMEEYSYSDLKHCSINKYYKLLKRASQNKHRWYPFLKTLEKKISPIENSNKRKFNFFNKKPDIKIKIEKNPEVIEQFGNNFGTCLGGHLDKEFYISNAEDPGTIYLGTYEKNKLSFYTRLVFVKKYSTEKIELAHDYSSSYYDITDNNALTKSATFLTTAFLAQELNVTLNSFVSDKGYGISKHIFQKVGLINAKGYFFMDEDRGIKKLEAATIWNEEDYKKVVSDKLKTKTQHV